MNMSFRMPLKAVKQYQSELSAAMPLLAETVDSCDQLLDDIRGVYKAAHEFRDN
jgi:hypothetical protein